MAILPGAPWLWQNGRSVPAPVCILCFPCCFICLLFAKVRTLLYATKQGAVFFAAGETGRLRAAVSHRGAGSATFGQGIGYGWAMDWLRLGLHRGGSGAMPGRCFCDAVRRSTEGASKEYRRDVSPSPAEPRRMQGLGVVLSFYGLLCNKIIFLFYIYNLNDRKYQDRRHLGRRCLCLRGVSGDRMVSVRMAW